MSDPQTEVAQVETPIETEVRSIHFVIRPIDTSEEAVNSFFDHLHEVWGATAAWATTVGQKLFQKDPLKLKDTPAADGRQWLEYYPKEIASEVLKECTKLCAILYPELNPIEKDCIKQIVYQKYVAKPKGKPSLRDQMFNPACLKKAGRQRSPSIFQFFAPYPIPLRLGSSVKGIVLDESKTIGNIQLRIGNAQDGEMWGWYCIKPNYKDFYALAILRQLASGELQLSDGGHQIVPHRRCGVQLKLVYTRPVRKVEYALSGTIFIRTAPGALVVMRKAQSLTNERPPWTGMQIRQLYYMNNRRTQNLNDDRKIEWREGRDLNAISKRYSERFLAAKHTRFRQLAASVANKCKREKVATVIWDDSYRNILPDNFAWGEFYDVLHTAVKAVGADLFKWDEWRGMQEENKVLQKAREDFLTVSQADTVFRAMLAQQQKYIEQKEVQDDNDGPTPGPGNPSSS